MGSLKSYLERKRGQANQLQAVASETVNNVSIAWITITKSLKQYNRLSQLVSLVNIERLPTLSARISKLQDLAQSQGVFETKRTPDYDTIFDNGPSYYTDHGN